MEDYRYLYGYKNKLLKKFTKYLYMAIKVLKRPINKFKGIIISPAPSKLSKRLGRLTLNYPIYDKEFMVIIKAFKL